MGALVSGPFLNPRKGPWSATVAVQVAGRPTCPVSLGWTPVWEWPVYWGCRPQNPQGVGVSRGGGAMVEAAALR